MKTKFRIHIETIEDSIGLGSALYHDSENTYFYIRFLHWGLVIGKITDWSEVE